MKTLTLLTTALLLGLASTSQASDGQNRHILVENATDSVVVEFYASRKDTSDWEEDILGEQVLGSGDTATVNLDDATGACNFDLKIVLDDGRELMGEINACTSPGFTVHD